MSGDMAGVTVSPLVSKSFHSLAIVTVFCVGTYVSEVQFRYVHIVIYH